MAAAGGDRAGEAAVVGGPTASANRGGRQS